MSGIITTHTVPSHDTYVYASWDPATVKNRHQELKGG